MEYIEKAFKLIGSRLKMGDITQRNSRFQSVVNRANAKKAHFVVDIGRDNNGEFFKIDTDGSVKFNIMGVDKHNNHLWHLIIPNRESDAWFIEETLQFLD